MIHGVINVYKEQGFTSHDVVAKLRGIVGQKKIGHTGTLDPDAVGVLPVCLGRATKLCDMLTDKDKVYEAVMLLGVETDTQDTTGQILKSSETDEITEEQVRAAVLDFVGDYNQVPPMYSALKINGKKLYELAREGQEVERKARRITIHEIRILEINLPEVKLEVTCSKGTYIRTLCHDIGQKLGCGGCMKELLRTRVERFGLEDSIRLGEIAQLQKEGILEEKIIAIDEMFPTYAQVVLPPKTAAAVRNGNSFRKRDISQETALKEYENDERVRVYDESHQFIAIYCYCRKDDLFKIVKMFFDGNEKK
mgnify:CR=1 FL=1